MKIFSEGTITFYDEFEALVNEINNKDNITPTQIVKLLLKHDFKDESNGPLIQ